MSEVIEAPILTDNLRDILDRNDIVGEKRKGPRRFWTMRELKLLRENYPASADRPGGLSACLPLLPGRSSLSIYQRAAIEGLVERVSKKTGLPRTRWKSNEHIDRTIRDKFPGCIKQNDIVRLAASLARPRWWVSKRAMFLGLVHPRFKEPNWTDDELEIIRGNAHLGPATIRRKLITAGFTRTESAIVVRLKRIGADTTDPNHYTALGLGKLMGIDSGTVARWIEKGWLPARRRGTARTEQQGGDQWWIRISDVRRFIVDNPAEIDIRKVDKFWFIDLLDGKHLEP